MLKSIKRITLLTILISFSLLGSAQVITVTGRAVDKYDKKPILGMSVYAKYDDGFIAGAVTDMNGYYSINVKPNNTLVFSFVCCVQQEIPVAGRTTINVEMDCTVCDDLPMGYRKSAHDFSILGTYAFNDWGYGFEYAYIPALSSLFYKTLRYTDLNIRVQNLPHSDNDLRFFPHLRISIPLPIPLFTTHQELYPYINAGYYFDTDFKTISRNDWAIGGGIKTRLAHISFKRNFMNILLTAGYTVYPKAEKKDNIYVGLKFYMGKIIFIE